ncbi:ParA family protein [Azospirillum sp. 11R-A]|uniref:nucleotide-binding protein n=1 Tax=Azospirillum sp. 11R-A TaxID=3111634 RepID=UPI003C212A4E
MTIIAFASGKGGVSKTTLAASLASYWAREGRSVACVDADPNAHLARWIGRMAIDGLTCEMADKNTAIGMVHGLADQHEMVVVDAARMQWFGLTEIAKAADLIVIPSMTSDGDTAEVARTYHAVDDLGQAGKAVAILTQADPRTVVAQHARAQIVTDGVPLLKPVMTTRVAYQEAWVRGIAPIDMRSDALAIDIAAIGRALNSMATR